MKNKIFLAVCGVLFAGHAYSRAYSVREIDLKNKSEVTQAVSAFFFNEKTIKVGDGKPDREMTPKECAIELRRAEKELIKAVKDGLVFSAKQKIFVCVSSVDNSICGLLLSSNGLRFKSLVEYEKIKINNEADWTEIMSALIAYAEKKYVTLGWKHIKVNAFSQEEYSFYLNQGFLKLTHVERKKLYSAAIGGALQKLRISLYLFCDTVHDLVFWGVMYKKIGLQK
jgi:hypothetical protein